MKSILFSLFFFICFSSFAQINESYLLTTDSCKIVGFELEWNFTDSLITIQSPESKQQLHVTRSYSCDENDDFLSDCYETVLGIYQVASSKQINTRIAIFPPGSEDFYPVHF